ncbi:MAG: DUF1553 domain-containing protein [Proteobacteria bacterium]|nr:DUF1553 domain-containing protein [Pseudomonadota bacterium]
MPQQALWIVWLRNGLLLALVAAGALALINRLWSPHPLPVTKLPGPVTDIRTVVQAVDAAFQADWKQRGLQPAGPANSLTLARRLSIALTGTVPSLQEIRALETLPEPERARWWIAHLFEDRRYSDYLAERLARAYVGVEDGPFLIYRRRRLADWLSDALHENRRYDEIARALMDSTGMWTTRPEVNFVTVTVEPNKGPDKAKLAARVTRAFLGVRIDCVQCHDGKLGSQWKQQDFHQLAAWFAPAEMSLTGLRDNSDLKYEYRYLRTKEARPIQPVVPWSPELVPAQGTQRERLAGWVTAPGNRPFARAVVNRVWALIFNRPLVTPVDDIPLHGPFPPGLEILADDFTAHGCDLQRLIRVIAATRVFQLDSRAADGGHAVPEEADAHWASFPLTRLRPEQMAGSVIQASSLTTINAESHVLFRIKRAADLGNFVKRYGDLGEDEFGTQGGTIPQRLLLMNGEIVRDHTDKNPLLNASTRIGTLAPDDISAVETAYLAAFTRQPTPEESQYFVTKLKDTKGDARSDVMSDLYWTLLNSTEFSWNH